MEVKKVNVVFVLVNRIPLRLSYEELTTQEKSQRQGGFLDRTAELEMCKVIINRNAQALYSMRLRTHNCSRPYNCYMERSQGSHNYHTHETQAVLQLRMIE